MPTKIVLQAQARKLGVPEYRKLSEAELVTAIKNAEGTGSAPAKGKGKAAPASTNGNTATATPVKGKGKATPAKGKAAPAKGKPAPAKGKVSPVKSTSTSVPAKSTSRKSTSTKTAAAKGAQAKRQTAGRAKAAQNGSGTRAAIQGRKINWNIESNVGRSGKRMEVLDALAEFKGDYEQVFKKLKRKAAKWYPDGGSLNDPLKMLRWLIGRVAYDYAYKTGQHEPAERAAYGTSEKASDVRRREMRGSARKPARKAAAARTGARKAAPAKGRKTAAAKGRKTAARKGR